MKNVVLIGASGHSEVVADIIKKNQKYNIVGFLDDNKEIGKLVYNYKILGKINHLREIKKTHNLYGLFIGVGDNTTRKKLKSKIDKMKLDLKYISITHPNSILAEDIYIPEGTVVMAGAIINANAKVGRFCILNTKSSLGHDSQMEDFSSLASGVTIGGNVTIGTCSAICIGTTIVNNKTVGNYSVIGASSLVLKNIGDLKIAYGSPIHTIKDRAYSDHYLH